MTPPVVKRLVLLSVLATSVAMLFMVAGIVYPNPLVLVLVMSIGQGVGLLSLALFLLAVALDLQSTGSPAAYRHLPESDDVASSGVSPGA